jgi:hydroxyacylglutathione hydrolase
MPVQWFPGDGYMANSYLFGSILIDAGVSPIALEPFREQIDRIILTHCHYDHTAHAREIAQLCDAEVSIHILDAPFLRDDRKSVAMMFGERAPSILPEHLLQEGERIGELEVLHTPGHTPGSICLYHQKGKLLFTGDTIFPEGSFGRYDLPGGSLVALRQSVDALSRLDVEGLYPGHGMPVRERGSRHIAASREILKVMHG